MKNLSGSKYNFVFLCHVRGVNVPDFSQHHLLCSRFLVLVQFTMFHDNFLESSFFIRYSTDSVIVLIFWVDFTFFYFPFMGKGGRQQICTFQQGFTTIQSKFTESSQNLHILIKIYRFWSFFKWVPFYVICAHSQTCCFNPTQPTVNSDLCRHGTLTLLHPFDILIAVRRLKCKSRMMSCKSEQRSLYNSRGVLVATCL